MAGAAKVAAGSVTRPPFPPLPVPQVLRDAVAYDQNISLYESAEARIASLRAEPDFDTADPLYREAVRQMTGAAQMARSISSEYKAMSEFADKEMWKNKDLPETLEVPAGM